MRKSRVGWSIALALLLLLSLTPASAAGDGPEASTPRYLPQYPELAGPGVVTYDVSNLPPIKDSHRVILQGVRRPDGNCSFTYKTPPVRLGDPIPAARELAFDRATCRTLIEEGGYAGPPPPTGVPSSGPSAPVPASPAHGTVIGRLSSSDGAAPRVSGWQYSYEFAVRWWDPVGAKLSEARPYVLWNSNGSTITNCAGNTSTWWFSTSGWAEVAKNISVTYNSTQTQCTSSGFVHHENTKFCVGGNPTEIYYDRASIMGDQNGVAWGSKTTWDSGGCYDWLHWDTYGPYQI